MSSFNKKLLINILVILGIIIVGAVFIYLLKLNIEHQKEIISDIKSKQNQVSQSSDNLSSLIRDKEIVDPYLEQIRDMVPKKEDLVNLKNDLNQIARERNVSLNFNFGTEAPGVGGGLGSVGFNSQADGSSEGLISFLKEIEKRYLSIKITTFEINRLSQSLLRLSLNGQINFINQQ